MKSARVVDCDRSRSSNGIWPALAPIATWARAGTDWKSPIENHCFPIWVVAGVRIGLVLQQLGRKEFRFDINRTVSRIFQWGEGGREKKALAVSDKFDWASGISTSPLPNRVLTDQQGKEQQGIPTALTQPGSWGLDSVSDQRSS